jgi:hypothetical protein
LKLDIISSNQKILRDRISKIEEILNNKKDHNNNSIDVEFIKVSLKIQKFM